MAERFTLKVLLIWFSIHSVYQNDSSKLLMDNVSDLVVYEVNTTEKENCSSCSTENSTNVGYGSEYFGISDTVEPYNSTFVEVPGSADSNATINIREITTPVSWSTDISTDGPNIKTTDEHYHDMNIASDSFCDCDLTIDYCDINCCCDEVCTSGDRQVFTYCIKRPSRTQGPHYCYQTNFVYHNNTEYRTVQTKDGLICILWDNLPPLNIHYRETKTLTSLHEFKRLFRGYSYYLWPSLTNEKNTFQSKPYRFGSMVWNINNVSIVPLALPSKLVSASCQISVPIQYLIDWSGSCSSPIMKCGANNKLNAASYYASQAVIATPQLVNLSQTAILLEQQGCQNVCVPFSLLLCPSDTDDIEDCYPVNNIESPLYDNDNEICLNVVKRVHYVVQHNGTRGIIKLEAYFWLIDVILSVEDIQQTFSISFIWIDKPRKPFQRSGLPGYILGKPVIVGRKSVQLLSSNDERSKEAVLVSEEPSRWLTLPKTGPDGHCKWGIGAESRLLVNFGENMKSSCFVEFSAMNFSSMGSCSLLQKKLLELLIGNALVNVTEVKQFNMYVAAFGDANIEQLGDWVQVVLEHIPLHSRSMRQEQLILICKNIVTSVHIDIVIAKEGVAAWPQMKILGVALKFVSVQDLLFDCYPYLCSSANENVRQKYSVSSSVTFLDVSKPHVAHFAEPPVYEVKLPYDFFYPFLSRSCFSQCYANWHVIFWGIVYSLQFRQKEL